MHARHCPQPPAHPLPACPPTCTVLSMCSRSWCVTPMRCSSSVEVKAKPRRCQVALVRASSATGAGKAGTAGHSRSSTAGAPADPNQLLRTEEDGRSTQAADEAHREHAHREHALTRAAQEDARYAEGSADVFYCLKQRTPVPCRQAARAGRQGQADRQRQRSISQQSSQAAAGTALRPHSLPSFPCWQLLPLRRAAGHLLRLPPPCLLLLAAPLLLASRACCCSHCN